MLHHMESLTDRMTLYQNIAVSKHQNYAVNYRSSWGSISTFTHHLG